MASNEWIGIIHTTRPKYMKGESDSTIRSRLLLSMLRDRGRLEYNASGDECKWQVEFSQPDIEAVGDGGVLNFASHDAYRQLSHDWRGYAGTDVISKKQNAMNAGDEQLINLFEAKNNNLMKAIKDTFCGELYKDGEATGRENNIHGLETFLAEGTVVAADICAEPSDTYGLGSLSTALGNQGGSWSSDLTTSPNANAATDWPYGSGDSEYDYLSPRMANWSSNNWGTGSQLWEDNCWRAIATLINWMTVSAGPDGMPDICILENKMFTEYEYHEEAIRRINVPHKRANDLGFNTNVLNQNGVAIAADFDCPVDTGYMLNLDQVTISSLFPELFWGEGPDKDPRSQWSWLFGVGFYGNAKYNPRHVGKLKNFAS